MKSIIRQLCEETGLAAGSTIRTIDHGKIRRLQVVADNGGGDAIVVDPKNPTRLDKKRRDEFVPEDEKDKEEELPESVIAQLEAETRQYAAKSHWRMLQSRKLAAACTDNSKRDEASYREGEEDGSNETVDGPRMERDEQYAAGVRNGRQGGQGGFENYD